MRAGGPDPGGLDPGDVAAGLRRGWFDGVAFAVGPTGRRVLLRRLAADHLSVPEAAVTVEHVPGRAPRLVAPAEVGLHLSCSSRGPVAAAAVARSPVGIDVELLTGPAEPPWNVLHGEERAHLRACPPHARAFEVLRLWSVKEAYLKALGVGLAREPASVAVRLGDGAGALVRDGGAETAGRCHPFVFGDLQGCLAIVRLPGARLDAPPRSR